MNALIAKGNWNIVSGKFKQIFSNLTDADLLFEEGKEEELLGRLQKKIGKSKEELRIMVETIGGKDFRSFLRYGDFTKRKFSKDNVLRFVRR